MVMLAIVVLGLFSYQRMQVDQFPNIDLPVVVITADYPGASQPVQSRDTEMPFPAKSLLPQRWSETERTQRSKSRLLNRTKQRGEMPHPLKKNLQRSAGYF